LRDWGDTVLRIDFAKYSSILKEIKKLAEEEVRPVELEVIYILKRYVSGQLGSQA
jgi:hypothetical protein